MPTNCEKSEAILQLLYELAKGEQSAKEKGWLTISEVEKLLGVVDN